MASLNNLQLFKWLALKDKSLAHRLLQLRIQLEGWTPHIVTFFPHYPSHGLDHSDRIVAQLSRLLFNSTTPKARPVVSFSTAEAYCLLAAIYLHDIGMVIAPLDAERILTSHQWKDFVADGGRGYAQYERYLSMRKSAAAGSDDAGSYFADLALRYLIADFVRSDHHDRSKATLSLHPHLRTLADDGDPVAFETIADIGVGHGLQDRELSDSTRFPEERDVFDGKVNVRFLARLLRIGDLLDMSQKRALPLAQRAVTPLPTEAAPHWAQYYAKKHENITPKVVEFTFECDTQDTHRVLRDWFSWLESEISNTAVEQTHSVRHDDWKAPRCLVGSHATRLSPRTTKSTIVIQPSSTATYTFHDWRMEFDHQTVVDRLVHDLYDSPVAFLRELIQNALDATRCQMYRDNATLNPANTTPERPTQVASDFRKRYPIRVSLTWEDVASTSDEPAERRPVIVVEDCGTGMSEEIILRYFLQIGRSYYQSREFRDQYSFSPTSRFGIGFLSVFAVSNDVTVETAHQDKAGTINGIRLRLQGPKSYILTERCLPFETRKSGPTTGTRIRVVLRSWEYRESLRHILQDMCVAVEVPVIASQGGEESLVETEELVDGTMLAPAVIDKEGRFIQRVFPIDSYGVEGQLIMLAYEDRKGEGWCKCWSGATDLAGKRIESMPRVRGHWVALHGIQYYKSERDSSQWVRRCDIRRDEGHFSVSRSGSPSEYQRLRNGIERRGGRSASVQADSAVDHTARAAIEKHLRGAERATGHSGIYYIGEVLTGAPVSSSWQHEYPSTVVSWRRGKRVDTSVSEILGLDDLVLVGWSRGVAQSQEDIDAFTRHPKVVNANSPVISWADIPEFGQWSLRAKLMGMALAEVTNSNGLHLFRYRATHSGRFVRVHQSSASVIGVMDDCTTAGLHLRFLDYGGTYTYIYNSHDKIVEWLLKIRETASQSGAVVSREHVDALMCTVADAAYRAREWLEKWDKSGVLPAELSPPKSAAGVISFLHTTDVHGRRTVLSD